MLWKLWCMLPDCAHRIKGLTGEQKKKLRTAWEEHTFMGDMANAWSDKSILLVITETLPEAADNKLVQQEGISYLRFRQANLRTWFNFLGRSMKVDGQPVSDDDVRDMFCECCLRAHCKACLVLHSANNAHHSTAGA
jgi:hypothetical protein